MRSVLNHETPEEADEPEKVLDPRGEKTPIASAGPRSDHV
jgi:aerobic C4-dicarboxylate transport protein